MDNPLNFAPLLHQAGVLLQQATHSSAVLSHPVVLKNGRRSLVVRCQVKSTAPETSSIIIRQIKEEPTRGFSDWASLAFLSGLPEAQGIIPRFYGGDIANRLFLIEDLGEGKTLQDLLTGADPAAAHAALQKLASQMARLHAATCGKQHLFESLRAPLPEADNLGRRSEAVRWLNDRQKLAAWFHALDCAIPPDFESALKHISAFYREADGFLAFTHGDPAPSNNHFAHGQARLVDFEYGAFRHALYDITAWNILCPLPAAAVREMTRTFREELAKTFPVARDEVRFAQAWAYLCAYRALAMLTWMPPDILRQNRPWADVWTMREAVFVALSRLQQVTAPFAPLGPVNAAAGLLLQSLRKHGPEFRDAENLLPQWSAFKT